jgi:hypothetical protein
MGGQIRFLIKILTAWRDLKNVAPDNGYAREALRNPRDKQTEKVEKRATETVTGVLLRC